MAKYIPPRRFAAESMEIFGILSPRDIKQLYDIAVSEAKFSRFQHCVNEHFPGHAVC
jgi:hypothetical protein